MQRVLNYLRDPYFATSTDAADSPMPAGSRYSHVFVCRNQSYYVSHEGQDVPVDVIPFEDLRARALDVLSQEVTLLWVGDTLRYITREDFLLSLQDEESPDISWLHILFSSIPKGLLVVDLEYAVVNSNSEALRMLRIRSEELPTLDLRALLGTHGFQYVQLHQTPLLNQVITLANQPAAILVDYVPLLENHVMTGFALVIQDLPSVETMAMELDSVRGLNEDLQAILSTLYDELVVVDADGKILRASTHYLPAHWERPPHELIGQFVHDVLPDHDLVCQIIRKVQKTKRKVSLLQQSDDMPLFSVGNPIFTVNGRLDRIVVASRDQTEMARLQRELEWTRRQSENYKKRLEELQERNLGAGAGGSAGPVYASPTMFEVMREAERIAQFSATVLLTGESGVGKEVIVGAIHAMGPRRDAPLIKINCASIPESLLESELFGYVKGAFSGAKTEGKTGLFAKANKGILFLDEISELPLNLQSKLLRAIQEREVYPVGATDPIRFDVQLIVAANRSLADMVETGLFREDLFYRINVFPIHVPPLRERVEDIAVLSNHMIYEFNKTYNRNLRLSSGAIEVLEGYDFPGNVRELQNIIQRVCIKNDGDIIEPFVVERALLPASGTATGRRRRQTSGSTAIVPLKQAIDQLEEDLILRAMAKYGSTVRAAEALGISQSSVSRKYQKAQARA